MAWGLIVPNAHKSDPGHTHPSERERVSTRCDEYPGSDEALVFTQTRWQENVFDAPEGVDCPDISDVTDVADDFVFNLASQRRHVAAGRRGVVADLCAFGTMRPPPHAAPLPAKSSPKRPAK